MSGCIKYFDGNRKIMSFLSEDEETLSNITKLRKKLKHMVFGSQPVYDRNT